MERELIEIEEITPIQKKGNGIYYDFEYYDEPLFEYLVNVADEINPQVFQEIDPDTGEHGWGPSLASGRFAGRYFSGEIDTSFKNAYLADDIQMTIRGLGINSSKLWYLILWLKDFVDDGCKDVFTLIGKSPKDELTELHDVMGKMQFSENGLDGILGKSEKNGTLKFQLEGQRGWESLNNKKSLKIIYDLIGIFLQQNSDDIHLTSVPIDFNKKKTYADGYRFYHFYYYLYNFMKQFKWDKNRRWNNRINDGSRDKTYLVSKLLYVLKMTTNKKYYDDLDFLKNNLRQYQGRELDLRNSIYWS